MQTPDRRLLLLATVTKFFAYCRNNLVSVVQGRAAITLGIATHSSYLCRLASEEGIVVVGVCLSVCVSVSRASLSAARDCRRVALVSAAKVMVSSHFQCSLVTNCFFFKNNIKINRVI